MAARETAELLVQVGRLVQAEGYDGELSPAHGRRCASLLAPTCFPATHQHSRSFSDHPLDRYANY